MHDVVKLACVSAVLAAALTVWTDRTPSSPSSKGDRLVIEMSDDRPACRSEGCSAAEEGASGSTRRVLEADESLIRFDTRQAIALK